MFNESVGFRVRKGKMFVFNSKIGSYIIWQLWSLFLRLFRVVSNKESPVKDYYFLGVFLQSKALEYQSLSSILADVFICRREEDIRIWKPCLSESFSVKSFYRVSSLVLGCPSHLSHVWSGMVPPTGKVFL